MPEEYHYETNDNTNNLICPRCLKEVSMLVLWRDGKPYCGDCCMDFENKYKAKVKSELDEITKD